VHASFLTAIVAMGLTAAPDPVLVALDRWQEPARLVANRGPGEQDFLIVAEVAWSRTAPRDANRYAIHLVLPNGRTLDRPLPPSEAPPSPVLPVLVPASAVINLRPDDVRVQVSVFDLGRGRSVSNVLEATIEDFPTPRSNEPPPDPGPFGGGEPLDASSPAAALPRPGPDGLHFVRLALPSASGDTALFLATTEATNRQVKARLKDYDPSAGRSDEFALEGPEQPAVGLTPARALAYFEALSAADRSGVVYRLPTRSEWLTAARSGRNSAFWWGDEPRHPEGANFLGPEPALKTDVTGSSLPSPTPPTFAANPWGFFHTFGNVAEWTSDPSGGFSRLGGHFRTQPASPLPEPVVAEVKSLGEDPFVGVRPAFELSAQGGSERARAALGRDARLAGVRARFDPRRATVDVAGEVADTRLRRWVDNRLATLWWVAAVEDHLTTPTMAVGRLAVLGQPAGPVRTIAPVGRVTDVVPVTVRWANPLPVSGSEWWVNIYLPGGGHLAQVLNSGAGPGQARAIDVLLERQALRAANVPRGSAVSVALSLGAAAPTATDPSIVSNLVSLRMPGP
jgi:hypothetical protein